MARDDTRQELLARVEKLSLLIREYADQGERERAGGGSANYRKNPLQRHVRDIHAVTQHIGIAPKQYETSGRMLLGVHPDDRMLLL